MGKRESRRQPCVGVCAELAIAEKELKEKRIKEGLNIYHNILYINIL